MAQLAQILALALAVVLAVAYRSGVLDAALSFFLAVALGTVYTGHQLLSRLESPMGTALQAVLAEPESRRSAWTYWIYLATLAIAAAVIAETLIRG